MSRKQSLTFYPTREENIALNVYQGDFNFPLRKDIALSPQTTGERACDSIQKGWHYFQKE